MISISKRVGDGGSITSPTPGHTVKQDVGRHDKDYITSLAGMTTFSRPSVSRCLSILSDYQTMEIMDSKDMGISLGISCREKEKAPAKGETWFPGRAAHF